MFGNGVGESWGKYLSGFEDWEWSGRWMSRDVAGCLGWDAGGLKMDEEGYEEAIRRVVEV